MKHKLILSLALFAMSTTYADDGLDPAYIAEMTVPAQTTTAEVKQQPVAPQYDNRFGFSFARLIYEQTKADSLYFGLDVWGALCSYQSRHDHLGSLLEAEARLGYNLFYNDCDHFTPLVGTGYQYNNMGSFHHARFAYATAGFLYSHEFNTVFGWGINLKGLVGQQVGNQEEKKLAWGVDLCMPIIFRFAHFRRWDITLEPFYLYMESNHKHQGTFGGRGTVAYRF